MVAFARMEPGKQCPAIDWAVARNRTGNIDEVDRSAPVEPTHHRDFAPA